MTDIERASLACLNDQFRRNPTGGIPGCLIATEGILGLLGCDRRRTSEMYALVASYSDFSEDNDPHQEHDFGSFVFNDNNCLWKIEYFTDRNCTHNATLPQDAESCYRVLTIMLKDEY